MESGSFQNQMYVSKVSSFLSSLTLAARDLSYFLISHFWYAAIGLRRQVMVGGLEVAVLQQVQGTLL